MPTIRRPLLLAVLALLLSLTTALPATAAGGRAPARIPLPDGFQPEGIAIDHGTFYVGGFATGAIFAGPVRNAQGSVLVPAQEGAAALGLTVWHGLLFAAGGPTGRGSVYAARSGELLASYQLAASGQGFVNDVVVTGRTAWFTDSANPVLYRVPLGRDGSLPPAGRVTTLPLSGDLAFQTGEGVAGINTNGIVAARGGRVLVIVQTNTGKLFTVDPGSGVTREIDLGGEDVLHGDGLLLRDRTLYVVQNLDNQVAKVELAGDLATGRVVERITDPDLDFPTTIAASGRSLYVVNARFTTPATPDTAYWVARLDGR